MALVISGLGKALSAAATAHLASQNSVSEGRASLWINFGIAGSGDLSFGETFVASRITDQGSGRSWYPPAVWSRNIDVVRREIVTVDRPVRETIEGPALIEMEAAGFISVASRVSTLEFCQVVKVVSDDPEHSVKDIDRARVESLCRKGLDEVQPWLENLVELVKVQERRFAHPPGYDEWQEVARFSVSQTHQLRRLLQHFDSLGESTVSIDLIPAMGSHQAKMCLQRLREELDSVRNRRREA